MFSFIDSINPLSHSFVTDSRLNLIYLAVSFFFLCNVNAFPIRSHFTTGGRRFSFGDKLVRNKHLENDFFFVPRINLTLVTSLSH